MTADQVIQLVGHLAWPVAVVVLVLAFRQQIEERIGQVRQVEVPGTKFTLDPAEVKKVADQVAGGAVSPEEGAKRLEESSISAEEGRILRALAGEPKGRYLTHYLEAYKRQFQRLAEKGWVERRDGLYHLTEAGRKVARDYLKRLLGSDW